MIHFVSLYRYLYLFLSSNKKNICISESLHRKNILNFEVSNDLTRWLMPEVVTRIFNNNKKYGKKFRIKSKHFEKSFLSNENAHFQVLYSKHFGLYSNYLLLCSYEKMLRNWERALITRCFKHLVNLKFIFDWLQMTYPCHPKLFLD